MMVLNNDDVLEIESIRSEVDWSLIGVLSLAVIAGAVAASALLPGFLPGMQASLTGEAPQVYWFLARGSALVSFLLLWLSMALGLLITNRMARVWPSRPAAFELHQYVSLLGLGLGLFHGLILTGDRYLHLSVFNVMVPFAVQDYRPVWVGLGQVGLYVWALLVGSFYVRKQIRARVWRLIHFSSFIAFALALAHGLGSGTDSSAQPVQFLYWAAGASLLFLLYYRILVTVETRRVARN